MKYVLCIVLALIMCAPAFAEAADGPIAARELAQDEAIDIDLDGDGAAEKLSWTMADVNEYEQNPFLTVAFADGSKLEYTAELMWARVYLADMDGDGTDEVLITGDEMSDDYATACLKIDNGAFKCCPFANVWRGNVSEGEDDWGYGLITGLDGGTVSLTGSQDVLGTWFGTRVFRFEDGRFVTCDDGEWIRDVDLADADMWDYVSLTPTRPLAYTTPDGAQAELEAGQRIMVIASDKLTYARFVTQDGLEGTLSIAPDTGRGWGMLVNGESENTWFEYVPYAD